VQLFDSVSARVAACVSAGRFPLLVGGDCPVILGALAGLRGGGLQPGLVMVDGHEDAWPPRASGTGEASDSEVAIALGQVDDLPPPLSNSVPLVAPNAIAMLGPRDADELADAGIASLRDEVAYFSAGVRPYQDAAGAEPSTAASSVKADCYWLHIDLDALATSEFRAVDYPQPGGFTWPHLEAIAVGAAGSARCMGASVVIYNPDLDPDRRDARRLVEFVAWLARNAGSLP
jgi:arginase